MNEPHEPHWNEVKFCKHDIHLLSTHPLLEVNVLTNVFVTDLLVSLSQVALYLYLYVCYTRFFSPHLRTILLFNVASTSYSIWVEAETHTSLPLQVGGGSLCKACSYQCEFHMIVLVGSMPTHLLKCSNLVV